MGGFPHVMNFVAYYLLLSRCLIAFLYPQIYFDWWLQLFGIKKDYIPITSGVILFIGINEDYIEA